MRNSRPTSTIEGLKPANHRAAAEEPSATHTEHRPPIQQVSITREEFIKQIESFKTPKPEFHKQLLQVFDNDKSLRELNLSGKQIGDAGAQALATALETNSSLSTLWLNNNQIGAEGAQDLATALQTNKTLTGLDLWNNQIGDAGAQALSSALHTNSSLRELYLLGNQIGDAGVTAAIRNALLTNNNTKELKSTILHKARAIAKISRELAPIDQKDLAGRLGSMPDEIIAKITEFKEASIEPHNLTKDKRLKLRLCAIEDGRKNTQSYHVNRLESEGSSQEIQYVYHILNLMNYINQLSRRVKVEVPTSSEQGPVSELIFRIKQLETRGINLGSIHVTNKDGKYIYHYDAGTGAAAMAEKPLAEITSAQQAELLRRVKVEEARLSEPDPTSVTAIEDERSFVSRVTDKPASTSPNL
jgi:hypothetical protein